MKPPYRLGITHHLLFPDSMQDPAVHEATLAQVLPWPEFEVVDLFCAGDAAQEAREVEMIKASGKRPVYNTPLLHQIPGCDPNATDRATVRHTREAALIHLDLAASCGAETMNIASGPNPSPDERSQAWEGWVDFFAWFGEEAAERGTRVVIEPFDQTIGKNLLIGPTAEARRSVEQARERGVENVGLMVDMGHLPLLDETFAHALALSAPYLWHVHLGSAVMRDPSHPLYGDAHPPLGIPEGEHDLTDLAEFLVELAAVGYFSAPEVTLTLEMRPYEGVSPRASVERWLEMLEEAWDLVERRNS